MSDESFEVSFVIDTRNGKRRGQFFVREWDALNKAKQFNWNNKHKPFKAVRGIVTAIKELNENPSPKVQ